MEAKEAENPKAYRRLGDSQKELEVGVREEPRLILEPLCWAAAATQNTERRRNSKVVEAIRDQFLCLFCFRPFPTTVEVISK
ncbi:unnamed protein product, partial [Vitis vinifera]|uniref:Uncharacterized protein n=1 Tax=Vitis vinifera TaxID=29760 RepID=D7U4I3_VITVI